MVRRVLLVVALLSLLRLAWYYEVHAPLRSPDAPPLPLVLPPATSVGAIGRQLQGLGLVRHYLVFRLHIALRGDTNRLKAGEYSLEGPLSLDEIADLLVRGEVVRHDVTFPEGKCIEEMAVILEAAQGIKAEEFVRATRDPALIRDLDPDALDLEGYLFPDTYDVRQGPDAAKALVARMVERFRAVATPELPRVAERGLTFRQIVTLASLVEMETSRAEERPQIASVFWNRLKKGMLLQTDPAVIYALRRAGRWDGNIRRKDLDIESPYNTYRCPGLPPGPIASPGRESLLAVLDPAPVKYLYFVSRNDGTHHFSETLAEHERAVDRYQRRRVRS